MGPYYGYSLDELIHHWGDAYGVTNPEDGVWLAQRRDTREMLRAADPDELWRMISRDYNARPVPR